MANELNRVVASVIAFAAIGTIAFVGSCNQSASSEVSPSVRRPTPVGARAHLLSVGVGPIQLAAAGLSAQEAAAAIGAGRTFIQDRDVEFAEAEDQFNNAYRAAAVAELEVVRGNRDEAAMAQLQAYRQAVAATRARLDSLRTSLVQAVCAPLSETAQSRLSSAAAASQKGLPPQYRCVSGDESRALRLRSAVAAARIAAHRGTRMSDDAASVLAAADAESSVQVAVSGLSQNLASIRQVWNSSLNR